MKLFDWPNSYNSKKIRAVAFETDTRLELVPIDFTKGDNKTPEFLARNPNGKVPVLVDGNFSLWESNAILCYLASKDPNRKLLPTDAQQRANVDKWLFWQTAHLAPAIGKVGFERLWKAKMGMGEPDEAVIQAAKVEIDRFMGVLDGWLANRQWVADDLSVADFALASTFSMRKDIQLDMTNYKNISTWLERVESRPSWKNATT